MTRPQPQPHERYRHFKGTLYLVLAIAQSFEGEIFVLYLDNKYWALLTLGTSFFATVKHSETGEIMAVEQQADGTYTIRPSLSPQETVAWARPMTSFMAVVSSGEGTNFHRFEKVLKPERQEPECFIS